TVPLSAVARYDYSNSPLSVNHQGQFAASTISFNLPEGVSLSQAAAAIDETMARIGVPATVYGSFQGTARSFQTTLARHPWLVLRHGDGAELRQPLGIAIVGGLILSQLLTLYTTPVVYLYVDRFNRWWTRTVRRQPAAAAA